MNGDRQIVWPDNSAPEKNVTKKLIAAASAGTPIKSAGRVNASSKDSRRLSMNLTRRRAEIGAHEPGDAEEANATQGSKNEVMQPVLCGQPKERIDQADSDDGDAERATHKRKELAHDLGC